MQYGIIGNHRMQIQLFTTFLSQWGTNQTSSVRCHEIDHFRSYFFCSCNKISFIFTVFIIYNNEDRKSTRLNSSHVRISYAVFCLKKKKKIKNRQVIYSI